MSEATFHHWATQAMFWCAALTVIATSLVTAPYGRHGAKAPGPKVSARLGWFLMESPSFFGFAAFFAMGPHAGEPAALVLAGLWLLHYGNRTIRFPLSLPPTSQPMPVVVAALAFSYTLWNGYINGRGLSQFTPPGDAFGRPTFWIGVALFLTGFATNVWADAVILRLRATTPPGQYALPRGGLYDLIASPNYFAEIVEWAGFALAAGSAPAVAFAIYTAANLAPRAVAHRRWYVERFPDFPRSRRAVIPWVL